jgi:hypothetical protein
MVDFKVLNIQRNIEEVGHIKYNIATLIIPNLELYEVTHESFLNFQSRLYYELKVLFWDPYIRFEKNEANYKYSIRIYDIYSLENISKLEGVVNNIFSSFPFKCKSKKRKMINYVDITNKISKLTI